MTGIAVASLGVVLSIPLSRGGDGCFGFSWLTAMSAFPCVSGGVWRYGVCRLQSEEEISAPAR
jgi:hypothetical protein